MFALGHTTPLSIVPAQQPAATTQTPRRPIGAGGARGANRSGSVSTTTTHALFALKVQRKVSNGVAGLAAGGTSFGSEEVAAQFVPAQRCQSMAKRRRRTLAEDPGSTRPELHIPHAAAQSLAGSFGRADARYHEISNT